MPYDQFAPVYAHCSWCACEIYLGQSYYETEDGKICMDCLPDYHCNFIYLTKIQIVNIKIM